MPGRNERARRAVLTKADREHVFRKTGGRCHICGGTIVERNWQTDHVLAHSTGGIHAVDNYLPAHSLCNNYRWHYGAEELQWVLKLGVWIRHEIERRTAIGIEAGKQFCAYERRRDQRRRSKVHHVLG
jgi:5-methylcytosine-specific restriction endonuclease McrA